MRGASGRLTLNSILDKAAGKPGLLTYTVKGGAIHIGTK
jgi:hypothetical protein